MIEELMGKLRINFVPLFSSVSIKISLLKRRMVSATTSNPTPRPEKSLTLSFVEKPGRKMS